MTEPPLLNLHSQPVRRASALLLDAIALGEGARIEFKSSFQKEVIENLAAFANTRGGSILVGAGTAGKLLALPYGPKPCRAG